MIVIGSIIAIVVLAIYAIIITYLYLKQKKMDEEQMIEEGKIDMKIEEIRERLNEVESIRYPEKIDIKEEKER